MSTLTHWMGRARDDERGVGMVMAIMVSAIVFSLTALWYGMAEHQVYRSTQERRSEQASHAAEAGVHKAMALIAEDPDRTDSGQPSGTFSITEDLDQHDDRYGEYTVTVEAPYGIHNPLRRIVSEAQVGIPPHASTTSPRQQVVGKLIYAEVDVSFTTGFDYTLFATEEIDADDTLIVDGDIYGEGQVQWDYGSSVTGDVLSWGGIATRGTVVGNLKSAGALSTSPPLVPSGACTASAGQSCGVWIRSGSVQGQVFATANGAPTAGRVAVAGYQVSGEPSPSVTGTVWAETEIVGGGSVGTPVEGIAPPLPVDEAMPTFDSSAYSWTSHASPSDFDTWFDDRNQALIAPYVEGNQRITSGSGTVELGGTYCSLGLLCLSGDDSTWTRWKMSDDTVLYTDEKVKLSADIANHSPSGENLNLVIISTHDSTTSTDHAVEFVGDVSPPDSVRILVYAPNGSVAADSTLQSFDGAVYAESIDLGDNFNIAHADFTDVDGFTFSLPNHVPVEIKHYRDCPIGDPSGCVPA